jgi:hypothetical protein
VKVVVLSETKDAQQNRAEVVVTLFGPTLELLEERHIARYSSCDEQARAAAIVIAAWLTALPAASTPTVPLPPSATPTVRRAPAPPLAPWPPPSFQASAAALASLSADTFAPGLMIEAEMVPRGSRWSLSLAGVLNGKHHRALGIGEATWWRWGAGAGAAWRAVRGGVWLDLRGAFLVTRLGIAGTGFENNTGGTTWDLGGALGARLGLGSRYVQPWLGAWAVGWAGTQNVHIAGDAVQGEIPRLEALLGLGATFGAPTETF